MNYAIENSNGIDFVYTNWVNYEYLPKIFSVLFTRWKRHDIQSTILFNFNVCSTNALEIEDSSEICNEYVSTIIIYSVLASHYCFSVNGNICN